MTLLDSGFVGSLFQLGLVDSSSLWCFRLLLES